jgi:hypothetical protein
LGLSEFTPIGPATVNREQFRTLAGLTAFVGLGVPTQGLGGLVQGQYASAPLTVLGSTPAQGVPVEGWDLYAPPADNWIG